jgi:hypothetical protein
MGMLSRQRKRQLAIDQIEEGIRTSCAFCGKPGHFDDGNGKYLCDEHYGLCRRYPLRPADPDDTVEHAERWEQ